ncbi:unnamed protein product [Arctogadus glacialis]
MTCSRRTGRRDAGVVSSIRSWYCAGAERWAVPFSRALGVACLATEEGGRSPSHQVGPGGRSPSDQVGAGGRSLSDQVGAGGRSPSDQVGVGGRSLIDQVGVGGRSLTDQVGVGGWSPSDQVGAGGRSPTDQVGAGWGHVFPSFLSSPSSCDSFLYGSSPGGSTEVLSSPGSSHPQRGR